MTATPQENARAVLGGQMLPGAVKAAFSTITDQAEADLKQWMIDNKIKTMEVESTAGEKLGTITLIGEGSEPYVANARELLTWCRIEHPEEVETVEQIRPAYLKKLLDDAGKDGEAVDHSTGAAVPGIEFRPKPRSLSRRATTDAKTRLRTLVERSGLLELPASAEDGGVS